MEKVGSNAMSYPSTFKPEYIGAVNEYLKQNQDEYTEFHRTRSRSISGSDSYERIVRVKLPSIRGFAKFIGVSRKTIYNWRDENPDFEEALEEINQEQLERLINAGLEGSYNPTITKVLLSANHGIRDGVDTNLSGEVKTGFTDEQISRIAERVTARRTNASDSGIKKLSN